MKLRTLLNNTILLSTAVASGRAPILTVDFSQSTNSQKSLGAGWGRQEADHLCTLGRQSVLWVDAPPRHRALMLEIDAKPAADVPVISGQLLRVYVNGCLAGFAVVKQRSVLRCRIEPHMVQPGSPIEITFEHPCFVRLDLLGVPGDARPLALAFFFVRLFYDKRGRDRGWRRAKIHHIGRSFATCSTRLRRKLVVTTRAEPIGTPTLSDRGTPILAFYAMAGMSRRKATSGRRED